MKTIVKTLPFVVLLSLTSCSKSLIKKNDEDYLSVAFNTSLNLRRELTEAEIVLLNSNIKLEASNIKTIEYQTYDQEYNYNALKSTIDVTYRKTEYFDSHAYKYNGYIYHSNKEAGTILKSEEITSGSNFIYSDKVISLHNSSVSTNSYINMVDVTEEHKDNYYLNAVTTTYTGLASYNAGTYYEGKDGHYYIVYSHVVENYEDPNDNFENKSLQTETRDQTIVKINKNGRLISATSYHDESRNRDLKTKEWYNKMTTVLVNAKRYNYKYAKRSKCPELKDLTDNRKHFLKGMPTFDTSFAKCGNSGQVEESHFLPLNSVYFINNNFESGKCFIVVGLGNEVESGTGHNINAIYQDITIVYSYYYLAQDTVFEYNDVPILFSIKDEAIKYGLQPTDAGYLVQNNNKADNPNECVKTTFAISFDYQLNGSFEVSNLKIEDFIK